MRKKYFSKETYYSDYALTFVAFDNIYTCSVHRYSRYGKFVVRNYLFSLINSGEVNMRFCLIKSNVAVSRWLYGFKSPRKREIGQSSVPIVTT